jgi:thiosulfate dehydrogenase
MNLRTFSTLFLATCAAIGFGALASHRPVPAPATVASPADELASYGQRLVERTFAEIGPEATDPAKRYTGNNLACQSCHLDGGTNLAALPLSAASTGYPKFSDRAGRVISLTERVEECMTRSMNGRELPLESREMAAFLAYLRSIADPQAKQAPPAQAAADDPSAARGQLVYDKVCAVCHQPDGLGKRIGSAGDARGYQFPPLWGPDSFNDGAGMDQSRRSVGFIRHSMPRGVDPAHPQLSLQQAWDVAALLQSKPRPHYVPR